MIRPQGRPPALRGSSQAKPLPGGKKVVAPAAAAAAPRTVAQADTYHTLNYVYQRAFYLQWMARRGAPSPMQALGSSALRQFFALARRAVVRVDPSIKHSVCQGCWQVGVEGVTCHTTWEDRRTYTVAVHVCECGRTRTGARGPRTIAHQEAPATALARPRKRRGLSQKQRRRRWMYAQLHAGDTPAVSPVVVPPFAERMEGTPWKAAVLSHTRMVGVSDDASRALSLRGDHVVTAGLGRHGQVGDVVPPDFI